MTRVPREKMAKRTIFLEGGLVGGWMDGMEVREGTIIADLLRGSCALSSNGMGRERINRSEVMLKTASAIR